MESGKLILKLMWKNKNSQKTMEKLRERLTQPVLTLTVKPLLKRLGQACCRIGKKMQN